MIVGEEVKTASQGEVIGLFLSERIPRGLTMAETVAEIRRQGGVVYVPHPFDRMHAVPDYEHLLGVVEDVDAIEVYNPRVAIGSFNEEAARFAAKYRIPAGAGSDAHVAQGLGSVRVRMPDFDGPEEFLEALRSAEIITKPGTLLYVQALKFLETKATSPRARERRRERRVRACHPQRVMHRQGRPLEPSKPAAPMPATDDEIREKYLERAIRELNALTRDLQSCAHCPRGNLMPVLGSGHPQADVFLLKYAAAPSEIEEGVAFYGRSGTALMKSLKRLGIDPLAVYGTLCVKCPVGDPSMADPACIARVADELAIVTPRIVVVMGEDALDGAQRPRRAAVARRWTTSPASCRRSRPPATRSWCRTSTRPSTRSPPSARSGRPSGCWASGTRTCRLTSRSRRRPRLRPRRAQRSRSCSPPELSAIVACAIGIALVVAIVAGLVAVADAPLALVPALLGAGLLVAALNAAGVAAGATPFEVVLYACAGIAFAVVLDTPALALGLPLFVAAIDIAQWLAGGSGGPVRAVHAEARRRARAGAPRLGHRPGGGPPERARRRLPGRLRHLRAALRPARARGRGRDAVRAARGGRGRDPLRHRAALDRSARAWATCSPTPTCSAGLVARVRAE